MLDVFEKSNFDINSVNFGVINSLYKNFVELINNKSEAVSTNANEEV